MQPCCHLDTGRRTTKGQQDEKTENNKTRSGLAGSRSQAGVSKRTRGQEELKNAAAKLPEEGQEEDNRHTRGGQRLDTAINSARKTRGGRRGQERTQGWPARPEDNSRTIASTKRTREDTGLASVAKAQQQQDNRRTLSQVGQRGGQE